MAAPSPGLKLLTLLLTLGFGASCGGSGPETLALGTPPPPPHRPGDGLLDNTDLQLLVDLQVQRDGASLVPYLSDPDPLIRSRAAFALASVQYPEAGFELAEALSDPDPRVRRDAAFALGQLPDPLFGPTLMGALDDETDPGVRERILEAVGKMGDTRVLERLLAARLEAGERAIRNLAIARMGVRGETLPSGVQHLIRELNAEDPLARINAGYYFGRSRSPGPWAPRAHQVRSVLDSLAPDDPLAMHLLLGLGTLGDPEDNPRLLNWLRHSPDWRIRANAARALSGRGVEPQVRARLMEALDEPTTHVASYAAQALSSSQELGPREREELKAWIMDHPEEWRRAGPVLSLLGRLGEGEFILEWLNRWSQEDVIPRSRALGALASVPGEGAMKALVGAAKEENPRVRSTALGALSRRWRVEREDPEKREVYFSAFAVGLGSGDVASTSIAAPALADSLFVSLGSLDLLMDAFQGISAKENPDGMRAILGAMGEVGSPAAEAFIQGLTESPDEGVREMAKQALSGMRDEVSEEQAGPGPAERTVDWEALQEMGARPRLILETEKGEVSLVLDAEGAPLTVLTIAGFADEGKYAGVPFHRVVPNFVVQGGDFSRKDGYGGPGFSIRSEFTQTPYLRGVIGMASSGKDTEGSQFFITHSMQPHLDGGYTVFGWVEDGMDVVDSLYEEDRILSARIEPGSG